MMVAMFFSKKAIRTVHGNGGMVTGVVT